MPAKTDHQCFEQPVDNNSLVWRYLDFTKFFSLISTRQFFLCRADLLGDPFEGSYSMENIRVRPEIYKKIPKAAFVKMFKTFSNFASWVRQFTYVNCWHLNENESAAMWRLYSKSNEAVAIQTTYNKLREFLPNSVFIGLVKYIDYDKDFLPEGNAFYPFMHKRKSFAHEKEVRIVNQKLPITDKGIQVGIKNEQQGYSVPIDLEALIEKVYVAPTAESWYFKLVEEILTKYEVEKLVYSSKLDQKPVY
jgi:hypothetical protein